jgi:hypothetical protein
MLLLAPGCELGAPRTPGAAGLLLAGRGDHGRRPGGGRAGAGCGCVPGRRAAPAGGHPGPVRPARLPVTLTSRSRAPADAAGAAGGCCCGAIVAGWVRLPTRRARAAPIPPRWIAATAPRGDAQPSFRRCTAGARGRRCAVRTGEPRPPSPTGRPATALAWRPRQSSTWRRRATGTHPTPWRVLRGPERACARGARPHKCTDRTSSHNGPRHRRCRVLPRLARCFQGPPCPPAAQLSSPTEPPAPARARRPSHGCHADSQTSDCAAVTPRTRPPASRQTLDDCGPRLRCPVRAAAHWTSSSLKRCSSRAPGARGKCGIAQPSPAALVRRATGTHSECNTQGTQQACWRASDGPEERVASWCGQHECDAVGRVVHLGSW